MGGETKPRVSTSYPQLVQRPVGQQIERIYTDRLRQFTAGGEYQGQNLCSKIYRGLAEDHHNVKLSVYSPPNLARPTFKDATSHTFKSTKTGEWFGPAWSTHWFKIQLTIPKSMLKSKHLEFEWDANNEGMVWTEDGNPLQGLTGGGDRTEWIIPSAWRDGKAHTFYIEMACNGMFGNAPGGDTIQPPDPDKYYQLSTARICDVNLPTRELFIDYQIIGDAAREFPGDSWERHQALQLCNRIMDCFIAEGGSDKSVDDCRKIAQEYLGTNADSSEVYDTKEKPIVFAVGHCHIDSCWLWPWAETKRKAARSWSNQCDLMDRYPEHRFVCSQAQQYKWVEQNYPYVFDRVKAKVKQGTFQPIGGSWVEHDTNMPSGESLVRQFIYGQRYFESHFGERSQTFWLPDTFGYSAQLPQICRLAGMSRFLTQKLSWNNINNFPHTTFNWVALDGSQVLCHMPPSETYTADANFGDLLRSVSQHKSLNQDNTSLLVFGKGDGGGGPTREMMDRLRRCRGLSDNIGRLPRVTMGTSVDDFFAALQKKAENGTEYTTWYGELYFELHRGTYTTQANNKRNNRKQEIMLRDMEYLATLASLKSKSYKYPKKDLDDIWENVLLCQFHDCLPGSSIEMCYDDSDELYEWNAKLLGKLKEEALNVLGLSGRLKPNSELAAINTLPWDRSELVAIPKAQAHPMQPHLMLVSGGPGIIKTRSAPALASTASIKQLGDGFFQLSNRHFKVEVQNGAITSLVDLRINREVIAKGQKANQLVIFDDKPLYWQAWDVEVYHLESRKELKPDSTEMVDEGPYRVSVVTRTKVSDKSWVKTTISLDAANNDEPSYVAVDCEVEWNETMKFLKCEFPVDVVNTEASYEVQYGIVRRPTHYNTTWDMAKFEVCCHKFADLSEANYGVSILNDSKYGFATCGNVMRLSLLRAPKAPDAHADMGRHHIRWAVMPHQGPLGADTVRTAYNFNSPMTLVSLTDSQQFEREIFTSINLSGDDSLVLDCIKRGEDDEDVTRGELTKRAGRSVILRIYESMGGRSRGTIETSLPVKKVYKTNVLEDDLEEVKISSSSKGKIDIELRAFEVATYRLQL